MSTSIEAKPVTNPNRPIFGDPVLIEETLHADVVAIERKYQSAVDEVEAKKVAIENRIAQYRRRYKEINEEISKLKGEQAQIKEDGVDSKNEVLDLEDKQGLLGDRMDYALDHIVPDDFVDPPYGTTLAPVHPLTPWMDPPYGAPLTGDARTQREYASDDYGDFDDDCHL